MAIAIDTSATIGTGTTAYTCTGSARFLIVTVRYNNGSNGTISGITYNGVALTNSIPKIGNNNSSGFVELWSLVSPASGSNNIVISWGSGPTGSVSAYAASYTAVNAAETTATATPASGTATAVVTPTVDNAWLVGTGVHDTGGGGNPTGSAGTTTQRQAGLWDSNGPVSPAAATNVTFTGNNPTGVIAIALKPAIQSVATLAQGSFTLTGNALAIVKAHSFSLVLSTGSFALTGYGLTLGSLRWRRLAKSNSIFTYLLDELGAYLLLEDGGRIILTGDAWINRKKH
jgi:hypothetical protein